MPSALIAQAEPYRIETDSLTQAAHKSVRREWVPPVVMMTVGALALELNALKDINRTVRHHVLASNPNTHNTLEDKMRHLPTASTFVLLPALGIKSKHKLLDKAIIYSIATTIGDQTAARLKTASKERRPDGSDLRSFPSGHTTTAFIAAEIMRKEYQDTSPWLVVIGYTAAATTGALRVYHNKHWLTDVIAGAGLGILSTDLAYLIHTKAKTFQSRLKQGKKLTLLPAFQSRALGIGLVYKPD
ncbi:MAG: phosphatase PAP2 family protein [Sphingobacteriaceae bacterium]|nr:phosphatase PAP2 family protein [Sphingobacteriaceae bacterium]